MAVSFRAPALACALLLAAVAVPVPTVQAQQQAVQRIPVSSILGRLDRLESEVVLLRQRPAGASGEVMTRIDQIEAELRRLTGLVERLEYDAARRAETYDKRMLDLGTRLQALESRPPTPFVSDPGVAAAPAPAASPPAPFVQPMAPAQPMVNLGGGPAVAFGAPRQMDTIPDLAALPFPTIPVEPSRAAPGTTPRAQSQTAGTAVALAGSSVAPAMPEPPAPAPVVLAQSDPQMQYDDALRLLNLGEFDAAGTALESLVIQYPQAPVAGSAHYWLGDMHLRLGRYNEAAKAFLDSFKGWPNGPKAPDSLLKLGMTLSGLGQRDEACLTFTEFPSRFPNADPSLLQRAQIEAERTRCGG